MKIEGEWDLGYILDFHTLSSEYLGVDEFGHNRFNNLRSEVGEALYKLKYQDDQDQVGVLTDTFVENLKDKFESASFVVPMPPSKKRAIQPLGLLAKEIANKLDIKLFKKILIKNGPTDEIKNSGGRDERIEALMNVLEINDRIKNQGFWDVLLIDDLYDSGASFTAATRKLRTYKKINKIYIGAFTKTGKK